MQERQRGEVRGMHWGERGMRLEAEKGSQGERHILLKSTSLISPE